MRLLHDRTLRPSLKYKNRYGARAPDRLSELSVVSLSLCASADCCPRPAHTRPRPRRRRPAPARRGDTGERAGSVQPPALRSSHLCSVHLS